VEAKPAVSRLPRRLNASPKREAIERVSDPPARGPAPTAPLRQITLVEMLASQLRATIVDQHLPAGSRLGTKLELARQYGVSMGTVHAAVRLLEAQGLAQGRPGLGGGVFVSQAQPHLELASLLFMLRESSDQASVRDLLEARAALDVLLIRRAAEEHRAGDVPALRKALAAMETVGNDPDHEVSVYLPLDWALHDAIAQAGHNATLLATYRTILGFITTQVQHVMPRPHTVLAVQENLALHRAIVESIVAGNKEAATQLAEQHRRRLMPEAHE
jgi:GntR family transcriptional regulator, transcriptional repressor for pyruvate dehydrogenase complex